MSWLEKLLPSKIQQTDPTERRQETEGNRGERARSVTMGGDAEREHEGNACRKCDASVRVRA